MINPWDVCYGRREGVNSTFKGNSGRNRNDFFGHNVNRISRFNRISQILMLDLN